MRIAAGADWKPVISRSAAREIAARAALALDNALLYERERDVSHTLQLGLLGGALPSFEHVVIASAYRPGSASLEVGGDWYDAFPLENGALALVVGDVVGHGLEAAVAMGQLRGAVSALAQSSTPALLLSRLDAFVETVPSAATATLAYVELDPATGAVRYACAGHPPPLVVSPDGRTRFLWDGRSAPLGSILGQERAGAEDRLGEGETLVLYTDGLVERRTAGIDEGLERLAEVARRRPAGDPRLADEICDALVGGESQEDDVCVLTLCRMPSAMMFSHAFPASPAELAGLREQLRGWLEDNGVPEDVERGVVLAVSEAAANAVEHGYGCDGTGLVTVVAQRTDGRLEISVRDEGDWREASSETDRGRGLDIIRAIVEELSIGHEEGATVLRMRTAAKQSSPA
jgi:serine/threonine-protein kinase RsbW